MEELFAGFFEWMVALPPVYAYLAIFAIAYGENVLPPIPGDLVVVFGGYMVGLGLLKFGLVVLIATVGGTVGFMTMYAIGYRIGDAVMDPHRLRWLPKKYIHKAQRWIHRWGYGIVLANRFLSGTRSVISLTVGMAHMRVMKTVLFSTISSLVWVLLITWGGYAVGENWAIIGVYIRQYGQVFMALLVVIVLVQCLRFYLKIRKSRTQAAGTSEQDRVEAEEEVGL